jgi:opine dehydrogenase
MLEGRPRRIDHKGGQGDGAMRKIAVVGAGNGGLAVAGYLGTRGHEVRIMDVNPAAIDPVAKTGSITLTGKIEGEGKVALATTSLADAVRGTDVIMVVVPGDAHGVVAEALTPLVTDKQIVVLHPGGAGGALQFAATFKRRRAADCPIIAEVESFLYGSNVLDRNHVHVKTVKLHDRVAALPARNTRLVLDALHDDFPQFVLAKNVLQTSLNHMNAMLHVAGMVMNAGWVETTKGDFEFYRDGLSPAVTRVLEEVDGERMAVSEALGAGAISLRGWIEETYHVAGPTLFETIQTLHSTVYKTSRAPTSLSSRYLSEDVPTGLVPIAALGEAAGVRAPIMRILIELTSRMHGVDYWMKGRNLEKMGLRSRNRDEIRRAAEEGP